MGRKRRCEQIKDGDSFHAMWQSHNQSFLLEDDLIKHRYYELLIKYAPKYGVKIYSYSFMSTHPHLYGTLSTVIEFSKFQHVVNTLVSRTINNNFERKGQVIRERYKIFPIRGESQHLAAMLYIDMNPVKAGIVKHPNLFPWSSFKFYAYGSKDPLITPAPAYLSLGTNGKTRQKHYVELINLRMEEEKRKEQVKRNINYLF